MTTGKKYTFAESLDRLAQVAVQGWAQNWAGLNSGQENPQQLLIFAPLDAMPLIRHITEHAYKAGATLVTPFISDDACILARYKYGRDESFDTTSVWMSDAILAAFKGNAARLAIAGANPAARLRDRIRQRLRGPIKVASQASKPAMEMITRHEINWTIVASVTPEWAALAFPNETPEAGVQETMGCNLHRIPRSTPRRPSPHGSSTPKI